MKALLPIFVFSFTALFAGEESNIPKKTTPSTNKTVVFNISTNAQLNQLKIDYEVKNKTNLTITLWTNEGEPILRNKLLNQDPGKKSYVKSLRNFEKGNYLLTIETPSSKKQTKHVSINY